MPYLFGRVLTICVPQGWFVRSPDLCQPIVFFEARQLFLGFGYHSKIEKRTKKIIAKNRQILIFFGSLTDFRSWQRSINLQSFRCLCKRNLFQSTSLWKTLATEENENNFPRNFPQEAGKKKKTKKKHTHRTEYKMTQQSFFENHFWKKLINMQIPMQCWTMVNRFLVFQIRVAYRFPIRCAFFKTVNFSHLFLNDPTEFLYKVGQHHIYLSIL